MKSPIVCTNEEKLMYMHYYIRVLHVYFLYTNTLLSVKLSNLINIFWAC